MRKTKIVCTLGPATERDGVLKELISLGMDVARFNFSHGDHETHKIRFNEVVRLREEFKRPVATMIDTRGPEIRVDILNTEDGTIYIPEESIVHFVPTAECEKVQDGDEFVIPVTYTKLSEDVCEGMHILLDDGLLDTIVLKVDGSKVTCKMLNGGLLKSRKGVNIPGCNLKMPFISEADERDIRFAAELGFDFIAASFVRRPEDVIELRNLLNECGSHMRIISKIENLEGVQNIDEIIAVSDGIMVARGDMGVEIPEQEVPVIQKRIIKDVYREGKQVITATQMLESMIEHNRPTRAEVNDVANAIYDGTSAIMLSGETAAGKYPVEALKTMIKIAERTESDIDYKKRFRNRDVSEARSTSVTDAISHAACMTAHDLSADAIIAVTLTGRTALNVSKFRPLCPIMGCTTTKEVYYQLNLAWGVTPLLIDREYSTSGLIDTAAGVVKEHGYLTEGGKAVVTAGVPIGKTGTTNMMRVVNESDY